MSIKGYVLVSRPLNSFYSGFAVLIGAIAAISSPLTEIQVINIIIGCFTTSIIAAGGYAINDVYDAEIDKINMPHRPIPAGMITAKQTKVFALVLFVMGVIIASTIGFLALILALVGSILLFLYAAYLKRAGFIGNLLVGILTAIPFVFGGVLTSSYQTLIYPALFAFLLILGREIIKDIEDVHGDKLENVQSIALKYGIKPARNLGYFVLGSLIIVTPIPMLLQKYTSVFFIISLTIIDIAILYTAYLMFSPDEETIVQNATPVKRILKSCVGVGIFGFVMEGLTHLLNF
ncbi:MAG: geranylgeranylglycerol-phosphate geranylgeranyltransferase [Candidatus Hodarchaeales archaeon]